MTVRRILHLSDIHFGCEDKAAVEAATAYCHATPSDLVLVSGDITQMGYGREFEAAGAWLKSLPEPVFVIVGNHDVPYWDPIARVFHPWRAFENATGHPAHDHEHDAPGLMVRGVVTARGWQMRANWSKGVIDLDQTRRAAEALKAAPAGTLRVLACHHPLVEMIGTPMTGDVKRGDAAAQIFTESGVDLIVSGHVHVPFALPIKLGKGCSYAVGCGTLSHRERGAPPSFNRIEWDDDRIVVTALGWNGSSFDEWQTWELGRRKDTRDPAFDPPIDMTPAEKIPGP